MQVDVIEHGYEVQILGPALTCSFHLAGKKMKDDGLDIKILCCATNETHPSQIANGQDAMFDAIPWFCQHP